VESGVGFQGWNGAVISKVFRYQQKKSGFLFIDNQQNLIGFTGFQ
jgi:hypothetical protein